jgi:hypothetical protein
MPPLDDLDWSLVPNRFRAELQVYLRTGRPPESIALIAILANNLADALTIVPTSDLVRTVAFLNEECPSAAWGSGERIARWEASGGFQSRAFVSSNNKNNGVTS